MCVFIDKYGVSNSLPRDSYKLHILFKCRTQQLYNVHSTHCYKITTSKNQAILWEHISVGKNPINRTVSDQLMTRKSLHNRTVAYVATSLVMGRLISRYWLNQTRHGKAVKKMESRTAPINSRVFCYQSCRLFRSAGAHCHMSCVTQIVRTATWLFGEHPNHVIRYKCNTARQNHNVPLQCMRRLLIS